MSTGNPTASAPVIGKPDLTVRFSREFLNGLFAELQAIDPLGQQPRTEPTGLLFGFVDDTSVRLEKFEPLHLDKSNETDLLDREAGEEEVLEKSVSAARLRHSPDPAVTGWYRVRAVEHPRLLDRDVGVHNRCFKSDRDVILIMQPEPTGRLTLEFYAAEPHSLLATHEHRRGLLQVASVNDFADGFEVSLSLTGTVNNELSFLSVFEALGRAERQEKWQNVRTYMPRFTGFVRTAAWFLATIIVCVLIYSTARLYLKPLLPHVASEASAGVHHGQQLSSQTALALKVSQNGSALELQWSPDSAAIQNATGGTLSINDGAITRQIDLDQAKLRSGSIVYTPVSDDVTFDLKVMDSASHSIADSIRVLGSAPGAASIGSLVERRSAAPLPDRSRNLSQSATASPLGGVAKKESLIGNQVSAAAQESSGGQALKDKSILEAEDWNRVKDSHNIADLEDFLQQYPSGPHAREAKEAAERIRLEAADKQNAGALQNDAVTRRSASLTGLGSLDSYLKDFQSGSDSGQAQHSLSEMPAVSSRDADAVLAALEKYAEAWNAKNIQDIAAIRPGLDRRTVKDELSNVRSVAMRIRPVSSPKIEGDRATVECIHEVGEVFSDGIQKENPGARMTYLLVRRGGNWLIEDSR